LLAPVPDPEELELAAATIAFATPTRSIGAAVPVGALPVSALTLLTASDPEPLLTLSPEPQTANSAKAQAASKRDE
jgi:hypothetical protein